MVNNRCSVWYVKSVSDYVSLLDKTIYLIVSYSLDAFRKPLEKHDQRKDPLKLMSQVNDSVLNMDLTI